jgi:hypothetical protein
MNFSVPNPLPGQPTLIAPNGTTNDLTPAFSWNAVKSETGNPATWYYLFVNGPSGNVLNKWYTAAEAGCTSGTGQCSVSSTVTLIPGPGSTYTWWVQGWNSAGTGSWSNSLSFNHTNIGGFNSQFSGSSTGWNPYYGSWSIGNGQYYTFGDDFYYVSSGYNAANFSNFDVETIISTTTPHEAYLMVRGTPAPLDDFMDWFSAYYFGFDVNGFYTVGKMVNGVWTTIQHWTFTPYLSQGGNWNRLRVVASDSNLYYYINGTLIWSGVDNSLTSGQIGFELGTTPSYGLWVDSVNVNSYAEDMPVITDTVSSEQQALNDAANANGSEKIDGGFHK